MKMHFENLSAMPLRLSIDGSMVTDINQAKNYKSEIFILFQTWLRWRVIVEILIAPDS